ncbi:MAG TPA: hypothetical protein PLV73_06795 [Treponemataceae bacterium]|nr:hypothetical protein [Treponemataceae bacterium]
MKRMANVIKPDFAKRLTICYTSTYGVKEAYDSSGDFWRVTLDENGKIAKVQEDGDKEHITIVTVSGEKKVIDRDESIGLSRQKGAA